MGTNKFRYYVSYFWSNDASHRSGSGYQSIEREYPICGPEDIDSIVAFIEKTNIELGKIVIIDWHKFESYE
jgi:hypothetical protein